MVFKNMLASLASSLLLVVSFPLVASAATLVTVNPINQQGWSVGASQPGGTIGYITDANAPAGFGALTLATDGSPTATAQYVHSANTVDLNTIADMSYFVKLGTNTALSSVPQYILNVQIAGTGLSTTLTYDPNANGTVTPGIWQLWNSRVGLWSVANSIECYGGGLIGKNDNGPLYTLDQINSACRGGIDLVGFGLSVGPSLAATSSEVDLFTINGTAYDFEQMNKESCKNNGWQYITTPTFSSQGQCIGYVESGGQTIR